MSTTRELAIRWWNDLPQSSKIGFMYKYKDNITGYQYRVVTDLTGSEIESIALKEISHIINKK